VSIEKVKAYREEMKGQIDMPDGSKREIRMPKGLWEDLDNLHTLEGITDAELVPYAEEEQELQNVSFDWAFSCVVDELISRYTA